MSSSGARAHLLITALFYLWISVPIRTAPSGTEIAISPQDAVFTHSPYVTRTLTFDWYAYSNATIEVKWTITYYAHINSSGRFVTGKLTNNHNLNETFQFSPYNGTMKSNPDGSVHCITDANFGIQLTKTDSVEIALTWEEDHNAVRSNVTAVDAAGATHYFQDDKGKETYENLWQRDFSVNFV